MEYNDISYLLFEKLHRSTKEHREAKKKAREQRGIRTTKEDRKEYRRNWMKKDRALKQRKRDAKEMKKRESK